MDLVRTVLLAGVLLAAPVAAAAEPWAEAISEASARFGLPQDWVREVIRAESGGDVRALSPKGAMGLMQLMPGTWRKLRADLGLGADPYQPRDNILAGVAYLRALYDRYGAPAFLAAYDAGPGRLDDYVLRSRPLPPETRRYLARLGPVIGHVQGGLIMAAPQPTIFVIRHDAPPAAGTPAGPSAPGLFVVQHNDPSAAPDTP